MAFDKAQLQGTILLSTACLQELHDVLSRKRFLPYIDQQAIRHFFAALIHEAFLVDPVHIQITACRDPKDDKFLSLAVSGQATHIITGDADLLTLHPFQGIQILAPSDFLQTP